MTADEQFILETNAMRARLEDHLVTLDCLRDDQKHGALAHVGLSAAPELYSGATRRVVESHLERYDDHMSTLSRYAHIVLAYICFEDRLRACGETLQAMGRGEPFDEQSGKGTNLLEKFCAYLQSMSISIPIPEGVTALHLIRVCIVHRNGRIAGWRGKRAEELRRYVESHNEGVAISSQGRIVLSAEACLEIQGAAFDYLNAVCRAAGFRLFDPLGVRENFDRHIRPFLSDEHKDLP